jgi:hypothetical protein
MPQLPKVDKTHPDYQATEEQWTRGRDTYSGQDAVRRKSTRYLPRLDTHLADHQNGEARYRAYVLRALFYNAVARTVDGLAGAIFQKAPEYDIPETVEDQFEDATMTAVPADLAMLLAARDVLKTGRYGVLVDMSGGENPRPYWIPYTAENILNWHTERIDGDRVLTRVVLNEYTTRPNPKDEFDFTTLRRIRVLELGSDPANPGAVATYRQRIFLEVRPDSNRFKEDGPPIVPLRRGNPLEFIPFTFIGPTSIQPDVEKPPLLDLIDVNLSHYRTSADLEHGLHHVGTPQLVITGGLNAAGKPLEFGSGRALLLPMGADAKIIQADGETLGALERADERKRNMMATLGARLLEEPMTGGQAETATAVSMRHAGDNATLATITQTLEQAFTDVIRTHVWWAPGGATVADPDEVDASVELNKDFMSTRMKPEELKAWILALQAEAVSHETFWAALVRGEIARPGVTSEEEQKQIEDEAPEEETLPGAIPFGPGNPPPVAPPKGAPPVPPVAPPAPAPPKPPVK